MSVTLPNIGGGFSVCLTASEWKKVHDNCKKCGIGVCSDHITDFMNFQPDYEPQKEEQENEKSNKA
jgi:hypothetical protein